jgi:hypothetical protein
MGKLIFGLHTRYKFILKSYSKRQRNGKAKERCFPLSFPSLSLSLSLSLSSASHYVAQAAGHELKILLPHPLQC